MGLIATLTDALFARGTPTRIGLYGPPNAGKTTLAARIADDWDGERRGGTASHVPHETRTTERTAGVTVEGDGASVTVDVLDTPGVATEVDHRDFLGYGIDEAAARERARQASAGIGESVRTLREDVDGVVYVVDSTTDPTAQVNAMLVGLVEDRGLPLVVLANKVDRPDADPDAVAAAFPDYRVVPVSAETGENVDRAYEAFARAFA